MRSTTGRLRILGVSGGTDSTRPLAPALADTRLIGGRSVGPPTMFHDAAAVLVCDGAVVAAIEEERLNRLKHTNKFPAHAIRFCLDAGACSIADIDRVAYYSSEATLERHVRMHMLGTPHIRPVWTAREYLADVFARDLDWPIDPKQFVFVEHHLAHATSAFALSPFRDALVVTLDGQGDALSGTVWIGEGGRLTRLADIAARDSLGELYHCAITFLGYALFDEYKVMGLAPYGDPARFRGLFEAVCALQPGGRFTVKLDRLAAVFDALGTPRRPGEPVTAVHEDFAAALQETVERAAFHLLTHYRDETGRGDLALAGGVAHNSTLVGKLLRAGLFARVFVQPASHDAGCALGAALSAHAQLAPAIPIATLSHVYWGTDAGAREAEGHLGAWGDLVDIRPAVDLAAEVARLIADGAVVGWVQGRSEFGPRALGNRSIVADPRPAANKARINDLVKKREAYRPFAPAVLDEYAADYFDIPAGSSPGFMTFTVPVREALRPCLGAVTHVDGTARVQVVSRATNARLWDLLEAFRRLTGIPVLLNTSFNHSVEPIVDSIDDAVTCFLTTGLTHLVIGDSIVTKRRANRGALLGLVPVVPECVRLVHARVTDRVGRATDVYRCENTGNSWLTRLVTPPTFEALSRADGVRTLDDLLQAPSMAGDAGAVRDEIERLWAARFVHLWPPVTARRRRAEAQTSRALTAADARQVSA